MSVTIRECAAVDIPRILVIEDISFAEPYPRTLFMSFLDTFPRGFRVAEENNTIAGYCVIFPLTDRHTFVITSLAVHPDYKRKKIATRLLEDSISLARNSEATRIRLQVAVDNIAAQNLYSKSGFMKTRTLKDYYGNGLDGMEMELNLDLSYFQHK